MRRAQDDLSHETQAYYDALAEDYRTQDDFWENPYDREIWRLEYDLLQPYLNQPGALLDLGCGFYPHFKFAKYRTVIAGDLSFGSLRAARKFGDESDGVLFVQFDATEIPFESGTFAYAIAGGELLNHIADYSTALKEIHRVLMPGGHLLLQVGSKWCLDTLWAVLDTLLGHPIGYAMTLNEASAFLLARRGDLPVTWAVTPGNNLRVFLLSIGKLKRHLGENGFNVVRSYGANSISGLVPLPLQQNHRALGRLVSGLITVDRVVGGLPIFRTFAGNVFFVCESDPGEVPKGNAGATAFDL